MPAPIIPIPRSPVTVRAATPADLPFFTHRPVAAHSGPEVQKGPLLSRVVDGQTTGTPLRWGDALRRIVYPPPVVDPIRRRDGIRRRLPADSSRRRIHDGAFRPER